MLVALNLVCGDRGAEADADLMKLRASPSLTRSAWRSDPKVGVQRPHIDFAKLATPKEIHPLKLAVIRGVIRGESAQYR